MELSNSNIVLAGVALKLGYSWVKRWWAKDDLKQRYVRVAAEEVHAIELTLAQPELLTMDDATEVVDIAPTAESKRRVRHRGLFRSYLVQQGKAKFGTPARTKANELVVRKYLYDECRACGLLPRHITMNLDFALEVIFMPSRDEILAKAVRHTQLYQARHDLSQSMEVPTSTD